MVNELNVGIMRKLCLIFVATILCAGCEKEATQDLTVKEQGNVIYAFTGAESRTYFEQSAGVYIHKWSDADEIGVFDKTTAPAEYLLIEGANTTDATFLQISTPVGGQVLNNSYAIYPYSASNVVSAEGVFRVVYPALQTYNTNQPQSYGVASNVMVGIGSNGKYGFKNACGFLELNLVGSGIITKIVLTGNDSEKIAGEGIVSYNVNSSPSVTMLSSATSEIVMDCGDGVVLNKTTPTPFIFALPPTTFSKGFTVTVFTDETLSVSKTTNNTIQIMRNVITPMKQYTPNLFVVFNDSNFEKFCIDNFDTNKDGAISFVEAAQVTNINCSNKGIKNLTGIEHFTNLITLDCSNNQIATLHAGTLKKLQSVKCYGNLLSDVDFSNCKDLSVLNFVDESTNAIRTNDETQYLSYGSKWIAIVGYTASEKLKFTMANADIYRMDIVMSDVLQSLDVSENTIVKFCCYKDYALNDLKIPTTLIEMSANDTAIEDIDLSAQETLVSVNLKNCPNLKNIVIWDACTKRNDFLDFDMAGVSVVDKDGNNYGYPYYVGQYIPYRNGAVVFAVFNAGVNGSIVSCDQKSINFREVISWINDTTTEWTLASVDDMIKLLNEASVINGIEGFTPITAGTYWALLESSGTQYTTFNIREDGSYYKYTYATPSDTWYYKACSIYSF